MHGECRVLIIALLIGELEVFLPDDISAISDNDILHIRLSIRPLQGFQHILITGSRKEILLFLAILAGELKRKGTIDDTKDNGLFRIEGANCGSLTSTSLSANKNSLSH